MGCVEAVMQVDFVNGVFDLQCSGYRVKLIDGTPRTLIRRGVSSKFSKQLGMDGEWGTFPDPPLEMQPMLQRFVKEQTSRERRDCGQI